MFSNKIDREELKPGDHIYSWRIACSYAHHGIYVGDGKVVHFTRQAGQETGTGTFLDRFLVSSFPPASDAPCETCGDHSMLHGVLHSCLGCFLKGGDLRLFRYSVSLALFFAQARGGTCTLASSDPPEDVLYRAKYLLKNGFGTYCIFKNNCEDFAIYCKTGLLVTTDSIGRSGQLASLSAFADALVSCPHRSMTTTSTPSMFWERGGMYCVNRYKSDIGVRQDAVKIPVERLVAESTAGKIEIANMTRPMLENRNNEATSGSRASSASSSDITDNWTFLDLILRSLLERN